MADDILRITLRLKTIDHLFAVPDLSPFDPYYAPYSLTSGMDYVLGEMQRSPRARRTELTVLLPPETIGRDLEDRTREAIARYSDAWATSARQTQTIELLRGRRVLAVAILFFIVANSLYYWYWRTESVFGVTGLWLDAVVEGLSLASWVALWWPLDQLLHAGWQRRLDERAYRGLQGIDLRVLPDPDSPGVP